MGISFKKIFFFNQKKLGRAGVKNFLRGNGGGGKIILMENISLIFSLKIFKEITFFFLSPPI